MRIIPVIDVLNGVVVRGVAGRRHEYRPIQSRWTTSITPFDVAAAIVNAYQPRELYLADLDAILFAEVPLTLYTQLVALGVSLWVDAGVRDVEHAQVLAHCGCHVVAGLETIANVATLQAIVDAIPTEQITFSLDLRDGVPLRTWDGHETPLSIVETVVQAGIRRVIVLDLARVGTGVGPGPLDLLRQLRDAFPDLELIAGGGVAAPADLLLLAEAGVAGVLVASALHDGRIMPATECFT